MFFFATIKEQWKHTNEASYNNSQSSSLRDTRAHKRSPSLISVYTVAYYTLQNCPIPFPKQQRSMNNDDDDDDDDGDDEDNGDDDDDDGDDDDNGDDDDDDDDGDDDNGDDDDDDDDLESEHYQSY